MKGLALKPAVFAKGYFLCVGRLIYPWLMENSQLDCLLYNLNFWISGQRGRRCVDGGKMKKNRSKFP
jgi:hypothetical protein